MQIASLSLGERFRRGDDAIKLQPYFAALDWGALVQRRLQAPWLPQLSGDADVAYVPKRVRDRRSASLHDEFGDETFSTSGGGGGAGGAGGGARISRQNASLQADDADAQAVRQLRRDREHSSGTWGDFSYAAPPRGETLAARGAVGAPSQPQPKPPRPVGTRRAASSRRRTPNNPQPAARGG